MREADVDLWEMHEQGEWIAITTNGIVTAEGENVMGAGTAREAARRYRDLPRRIGRWLAAETIGNSPMIFSDLKIITFPTKNDWRDPSDLALIAESARRLMIVLDLRGVERLYLPRPGCGAGGLSWEVVGAVLAPLLDDRVIVVGGPKYDPFRKER